jgi:hypothetical protein
MDVSPLFKALASFQPLHFPDVAKRLPGAENSPSVRFPVEPKVGKRKGVSRFPDL